MYKFQSSRSSGSFSWVIQRISGIVLVVVMISHYILMHYHPENGHTYEAVFARMQSNWYRVLDLTFIVLAMYHGLNGIWSIFRDYRLKQWQAITIMSIIVVLGLSFTLWGVKTILDIPRVASVAGLLNF